MPKPGSPGMPSALSPVSARKSGMLSGPKPRSARNRTSFNTFFWRRSTWTTRSPCRHWPRSLSGVRIRTCSTWSRKRRAPLARPSSASYSRIDQTATPIARTASSTASNCVCSSGGTPSSLLYGANRSLRNDRIGLSNATAIWVTASAGSRKRAKRDSTMPTVALASLPAGARWSGRGA